MTRRGADTTFHVDLKGVSPKVRATQDLLYRINDQVMAVHGDHAWSKAIGFAKPVYEIVGNELRIQTWKGYAVSIVVVVDKSRRG